MAELLFFLANYFGKSSCQGSDDEENDDFEGIC